MPHVGQKKLGPLDKYVSGAKAAPALPSSPEQIQSAMRSWRASYQAAEAARTSKPPVQKEA